MVWMHMLRVVLLLVGSLAISSLRAEEWPMFRGPSGQGTSAEDEPPVKWSATENVTWKTPIPGEGWSSPIVWKDHVFVTTATEEGLSLRVIALARKTGAILWNVEVARQMPRKKRAENSYASPTPCTDGKQVYAVFADGTMAALDFTGNIKWTNRDIKFYSHHGLGASPILFKNLLIMPFDGSSDGDDNKLGWKIPWDKGGLVALDTKTGERKWLGERGLSRIAHVTPIVYHDDKHDEIISPAGDVVQSFDPLSGKRLWSVYSQGEGVTPGPVAAVGMVFSSSGFEKTTIRAIRLGGTGDVTQSHIAWEQIKGAPTTSSLLYIHPHVYAITDQGVATCYKGSTGDIVWQERIGGKQWASPLYVDENIYFLSEEGDTTIIEADKVFKVVAKNSIGEKCQASFASSRGQLYLRSAKHLFCLGVEDID